MHKYLSKWANKYRTTKTLMNQSDGVSNSLNNESSGPTRDKTMFQKTVKLKFYVQ